MTPSTDPGGRRVRFAGALRRLYWSSAGSTAIEYAIVIGMIAIFVIGIAALGASLSENQFNTFAGYFK